MDISEVKINSNNINVKIPLILPDGQVRCSNVRDKIQCIGQIKDGCQIEAWEITLRKFKMHERQTELEPSD